MNWRLVLINALLFTNPTEFLKSRLFGNLLGLVTINVLLITVNMKSICLAIRFEVIEHTSATRKEGIVWLKEARGDIIRATSKAWLSAV